MFLYKLSFNLTMGITRKISLQYKNLKFVKVNTIMYICLIYYAVKYE